MSRIRAAWYVLTGRPVMFRVKIRDGVIGYDATRGALILDCSLDGVHIRQHGGYCPAPGGVLCAVHQMAARPDGAGDLVCPMDGATILSIQEG